MRSNKIRILGTSSRMIITKATHKVIVGYFGLVLCTLTAPALFAQSADIENIAPRSVPATNSGGAIIEEDVIATPQTVERDNILVPALNALVFTGDTTNLNSLSASDPITISKLNIPNQAEFVKQFAAYIGRPLSLNLLDSINRDVVRFYRNSDISVVDAFAPQGQDITDGKVIIVVLAGKLGAVRVEGGQYFSKEQIAAQVRIKTDEPLSTEILNEDIQWLNNNPFRQVNALLERGSEFGQTDLVLQVEDKFPLRVYAGFEDTGIQSTGEERWLTGINWGNAFGLGHQLGYQYTSALDSKKLTSQSINYLAPLPWRHTLTLFAARVKSNPPLDDAGFDLQGKSEQFGFRYSLPLPKIESINQELSLGADYKRSNNNLAFGLVDVFDTFTTVMQYNLSYNASRVDEFGVTGLGVTFNYSPGGAGKENSNLAFEASRANASADYIYTRFNFNRITKLPKDYSWAIEAEAQLANGNLLGSEQLGIGGYRSVRGYDEYAAVGDKGLFLRSEIRTPTLSLFKPNGSASVSDVLQLLAFIDYGVVSSVDKLPNETKTDLLSSGIGLRYSFSSNITMRADYGWQLQELSPLLSKSSRVHFSIVAGF